MVFVEISGVLCDRHYRMICAHTHFFLMFFLKKTSAAANRNFTSNRMRQHCAARSRFCLITQDKYIAQVALPSPHDLVTLHFVGSVCLFCHSSFQVSMQSVMATEHDMNTMDFCYAPRTFKNSRAGAAGVLVIYIWPVSCDLLSLLPQSSSSARRDKL